MTTESDLREFRNRWRLELLELLVLKDALVGPVLDGRLSVAESRSVLGQWLDTQLRVADDSYGRRFQDPAMAALYGDEVKDVVEKMKGIIDKVANELSAAISEHGSKRT